MMTFMQHLLAAMQGMSRFLLIWGLLPLIPFILAEQIRPVGPAPRFRDYGMNGSGQLREHLPWKPISFTFDTIGTVPLIGPVLEIVAMIFVPLLLHDFWFYWAHRIEHKVPFFWMFHSTGG